MDELSSLLACCFVNNDHLARSPIFGKENSALLEKFSNGCTPVMRTVLMPGKVFRGRTWAILARQVSTGEDVRRRERSRSLDPMEKQDLVLGRDQNHTNEILVLVSSACPFSDRNLMLPLPEFRLTGGASMSPGNGSPRTGPSKCRLFLPFVITFRARHSLGLK